MGIQALFVVVDDCCCLCSDPLRNLVYRVHPLPESMIDFIYDFGSLSEHTESLYIKAMLRRQLGVYGGEEEISVAHPRVDPADHAHGGQGLGHVTFVQVTPFGEFVEVFSRLVCAAQV